MAALLSDTNGQDLIAVYDCNAGAPFRPMPTNARARDMIDFTLHRLPYHDR